MIIRKKLRPQLILDDEDNGEYSMFDEVRLRTISEENEPEPKEKNGCFSVLFRFFCFFRKPSF
jgi:hypothetical protein